MLDRRTPLAWKNLTHDLRRLVLACGGIGFAVLLMFVEIGFLYALLDSTVEVVQRLNADLLVTSKALHALPARQQFQRTRIYQARACTGVRAYPLYIETFQSVLKQHHQKGYPIRVLAFHLDDPVFTPGWLSDVHELQSPGTALYDTRSKPKFGLPAERQQLRNSRLELADRQVQLVGTFQLGTDFANEGNLIMDAESFARYFPERSFGRDPLSMVDLGIIQVAEGQDLQKAKQCLEQTLPADVQVFTKQEFIERERKFWRTNAPVGYIFTVGAVMGFIVGVVICYQVIYSDVADHLAEFATLKAMGYSHYYFAGVVIRQSIYLSILGFIPGAIISYLVYYWLMHYTGLLMNFSLPRAGAVLLLTVAMCSTSGLLALRKLQSADPAELF